MKNQKAKQTAKQKKWKTEQNTWWSKTKLKQDNKTTTTTTTTEQNKQTKQAK